MCMVLICERCIFRKFYYEKATATKLLRTKLHQGIYSIDGFTLFKDFLNSLRDHSVVGFSTRM